MSNVTFVAEWMNTVNTVNMLERTDPITNEVLEPITFVLAYPTVYENLHNKYC